RDRRSVEEVGVVLEQTAEPSGESLRMSARSKRVRALSLDRADGEPGRESAETGVFCRVRRLEEGERLRSR
ncbi:hypothetical protein ACLESO_49820, partial [Pyxidicoccus sp. 3LG]